VPALGTFTLLATFVVAAYASGASVAGGRRRSQALSKAASARSTYGRVDGVASAILIHASVTGT
jgi:hypothetical protein